YSMITLWPSRQPSSRSRCTNAATKGPTAEAVEAPRKPILGKFPACCARAASGHATTEPPSRVMHSRRLMPDMGTSSPVGRKRSVYRALNLPQKEPQLLGLDLNRSESRRGIPCLGSNGYHIWERRAALQDF